MANTLDYLDWRGDLDFSVSAFNEVDMFICSQLSTPDYSGIVPEDGESVPIGEVVEKYFETHEDNVGSLGVLQSSYVLPMLKKLPLTKRYENLRLKYAVNHVVQDNEEQFCAVTIELPDGTTCVSFRGTDDTIIGWKEDFNLATSSSVPAQIDARLYLKGVLEKCPGAFRVCGHSKGGNLAVYAGVTAPLWDKSRILEIYNFDGPGFSPVFFTKKGYSDIKDKITTVLSQHSLVGTLLEPAGNIVYLVSCTAGPMAHDGFNWQVLGSSFERSEGLSDTSRAFDSAMGDTLSGMSVKERQGFIDELFNTLLSTGAVTITDLTKMSPVSFLELLKGFRNDRKVQSFTKCLTELFMKSMSDPIASSINKLADKIKI